MKEDPMATKILHTAYRLGGRIPGVGLDCLGVTIAICRLRNLPAPDPWGQIRAAWLEGKGVAATGFPAGWIKIDDPAEVIRDGDVLIFAGNRQGVAIVHEGQVWTADAAAERVYRYPVFRLEKRPSEVWRFAP